MLAIGFHAHCAVVGLSVSQVVIEAVVAPVDSDAHTQEISIGEAALVGQ